MAARGKQAQTPDRSRTPGLRRDQKLPRRRSCFFCQEKIAEVDYKNIAQLRRFVSERGKIKSRANTGACRKHQRQIALAIKRAREMALLPYVGDSHEPQARRRAGGAPGR
jgi:small subunit ribosomal protein S18